jgi:c-di-GMP-binding flagellar brake protein YcgR
MSTLSEIYKATARVLDAQGAKLSEYARPLNEVPEAAQRQFVRYQVPGTVTLYDDQNHPLVLCTLVDISAGGVAFYSPIELAVQSYISIRVATHVVTERFKAFVIRRDQTTGRYGVRFVSLSDTAIARLDNSLRRAATQP